MICREVAERRRETGDDRPLEDLYDTVPIVRSRSDSGVSETENEVGPRAFRTLVCDQCECVATVRMSCSQIRKPLICVSGVSLDFKTRRP